MSDIFLVINNFIIKNNLWNILLQIFFIFLGFLFLKKFSSIIITKIVRKVIIQKKGESKIDEEKRENTLIRILNFTVKIVLILLFILMILSTFGFAMAPLLGALGILGVAVGFGGQSLIKDVIAGFFILFENQYRLGDTVEIKNIIGKVENIALRITSIRDFNGNLHFIPNGEINIVSNLSRNFSLVNLNIPVSYNSDIDKVKKIINEIGLAIAEDIDWKNKIIEPISFIRLNDFADSAINIKVIGKVVVDQKWAVIGEFNQRLKKAFEKEKIEIPFQQIVIHQKK